MAHVLISFLGKASPKQKGQYSPATYVFADGHQENARFFNLALCTRQFS